MGVVGLVASGKFVSSDCMRLCVCSAKHRRNEIIACELFLDVVQTSYVLQFSFCYCWGRCLLESIDDPCVVSVSSPPTRLMLRARRYHTASIWFGIRCGVAHLSKTVLFGESLCSYFRRKRSHELLFSVVYTVGQVSYQVLVREFAGAVVVRLIVMIVFPLACALGACAWRARGSVFFAGCAQVSKEQKAQKIVAVLKNESKNT